MFWEDEYVLVTGMLWEVGGLGEAEAARDRCRGLGFYIVGVILLGRHV